MEQLVTRISNNFSWACLDFTMMLKYMLLCSLQLAAILTRKSTYAVIILSIVLLVLISFTGFVVRDIPVYFEWVKDISYLSFATAALLENELKGLSLTHNGMKISGDDLLGSTPLDDPIAEDTRMQINNLNNPWVILTNQVLF